MRYIKLLLREIQRDYKDFMRKRSEIKLKKSTDLETEVLLRKHKKKLVLWREALVDSKGTPVSFMCRHCKKQRALKYFKKSITTPSKYEWNCRNCRV